MSSTTASVTFVPPRTCMGVYPKELQCVATIDDKLLPYVLTHCDKDPVAATNLGVEWLLCCYFELEKEAVNGCFERHVEWGGRCRIF